MFVRWSPDGHWLYFASGRAPEFQLFRQPANGGRPEQLTSDRGLAGIGVVTWFAVARDGQSGGRKIVEATIMIHGNIPIGNRNAVIT